MRITYLQRCLLFLLILDSLNSLHHAFIHLRSTTWRGKKLLQSDRSIGTRKRLFTYHNGFGNFVGSSRGSSETSTQNFGGR